MNPVKKYRFADYYKGNRVPADVIIAGADNAQEAEMLGYRLIKNQSGAVRLLETELKLLECF